MTITTSAKARTPQSAWGQIPVTQAGLVAPRTVLLAAALCFAASVCVGVYLVAAGGWPVVAIGLLSILAGWAYTGGPAPWAISGWVRSSSCCSSASSPSGARCGCRRCGCRAATWLAALSVGSTATLLIVVNNLRDIDTDRLAGKHTLAARFGQRFARGEYVCVLAVAFLSPVAAWALGQVGMPQCSGPWPRFRWPGPRCGW